MPALRRKQNYRHVILAADTEHETVGVYLRSGLTRDVIWRGFVDIGNALGTPVRLDAHSYQVHPSGPWVTLMENEYIQGCVVVDQGVYGVAIGGIPRVIRATTPSKPV